MARNSWNRQRHATLNPLPPLAAGVLICCVFALAYVCIGNRCQAVEREIQRLEQEREDLEKSKRNEESKLTMLTALPNLTAAMRRDNIALVWPASRQIERLTRADVYGERWVAARHDGREVANLGRERLP